MLKHGCPTVHNWWHAHILNTPLWHLKYNKLRSVNYLCIHKHSVKVYDW